MFNEIEEKEESIEEVKQRLQTQMKYSSQPQMGTLDNISDALNKVQAMYGNVTIEKAMDYIQRLKNGYLM